MKLFVFAVVAALTVFAAAGALHAASPPATEPAAWDFHGIPATFSGTYDFEGGHFDAPASGTHKLVPTEKYSIKRLSVSWKAIAADDSAASGTTTQPGAAGYHVKGTAAGGSFWANEPVDIGDDQIDPSKAPDHFSFEVDVDSQGIKSSSIVITSDKDFGKSKPFAEALIGKAVGALFWPYPGPAGRAVKVGESWPVFGSPEMAITCTLADVRLSDGKPMARITLAPDHPGPIKLATLDETIAADSAVSLVELKLVEKDGSDSLTITRVK